MSCETTLETSVGAMTDSREPDPEHVMPEVLNVLIRCSGSWWTAEGIEHDLATQARSPAELIEEFEILLIAHVGACRDSGIPAWATPAAPEQTRLAFEGAPFVLELRDEVWHGRAFLGGSTSLPRRVYRMANR